MKFDDTDMAILKQLVENSWKHYNEIAKELGITPPTVKARIERMKGEGVIRKFTVELDTTRICNRVLAFLCIDVENTEVDSIIKVLEAMPEVTCIYRVSGNCPLMAKVQCESLDELNVFLSERLNVVSGVRGVESRIVLDLIKETNDNILTKGSQIELTCIYCGRNIKGVPVQDNIGGKRRNFCCNTCREVYKKKYV